MVTQQIQDLVNRHRSLNLAFVDAYLPEDERGALLDGLNALPEDITFFSELRCDLDEAIARKIAPRARHVQLGVESFSTAILRKIGKGVSAAHSVYNVRICQEMQIPLQYNLMLEIPGVSIPEIEALAEDLPVLIGLIPPQPAHFYLDRNSLMFLQPGKYGLRCDRMDLARHDWLPARLGDNAISQIVSYTLDDSLRAAWAGIERKIKTWRQRWQRALANEAVSPLSWRGGKGWAKITDLRGEKMRSLELEGLLYEVFAKCGEVITVDKLAAKLPAHGRAELTSALDALVEAGLVFRDGTRHVRVAIHANRVRGEHQGGAG